MNSNHAEPVTADEELGSPAWTLELGWLIGLAVGLVMVLFVSHRRAGGRVDPAPTPE